jgi:hypothetical protein
MSDSTVRYVCVECLTELETHIQEGTPQHPISGIWWCPNCQCERGFWMNGGKIDLTERRDHAPILNRVAFICLIALIFAGLPAGVTLGLWEGDWTLIEVVVPCIIFAIWINFALGEQVERNEQITHDAL